MPKVVIKTGVPEADVRVEVPKGFELEIKTFTGEKLKG